MNRFFAVAMDSAYLKTLHFRDRFWNEPTWKETKIMTITETRFLTCSRANIHFTEKRCERIEFSVAF